MSPRIDSVPFGRPEVTRAQHGPAMAMCVMVAVVTALCLVLAPARALAQAGGDSPTSQTTSTTVEHTQADQDRGSNVSGAIAGFGLLAGWLLLGYVQFRRGRRRLAIVEDDERAHRESPVAPQAGAPEVDRHAEPVGGTTEPAESAGRSEPPGERC